MLCHRTLQRLGVPALSWHAVCCRKGAGLSDSAVQASRADGGASRRYAETNLTDDIALNELLKEVQALRQVVEQRQAAIKPKQERVAQSLQEDLRTPVIEMMQEAAGDAERASRELIEAGGERGTRAVSMLCAVQAGPQSLRACVHGNVRAAPHIIVCTWLQLLTSLTFACTCAHACLPCMKRGICCTEQTGMRLLRS